MARASKRRATEQADPAPVPAKRATRTSKVQSTKQPIEQAAPSPVPAERATRKSKAQSNNQPVAESAASAVIETSTTEPISESTESSRDYARQNYWEERYQRLVASESGEPFVKPANDDDDDDDCTTEWYYSLEHFMPLVKTTKFHRKSPILDLGCGVSQIFFSLRDAGFTGEMIGIDTAPTALKKMGEMYAEKKAENMQFLQRDLFDFDEFGCPSESASDASLFSAGRYGMIIDKATSDGMMCGESPVDSDNVSKMYAMIGHCLAPGGCFIMASVQDADSPWFGELVLPSLLRGSAGEAHDDTKDTYTFKIDVHSLEESEYMDGEKEGPNIYIISKSTRVQRKRAGKDQDEFEINQHFH